MKAKRYLPLLLVLLSSTPLSARVLTIKSDGGGWVPWYQAQIKLANQLGNTFKVDGPCFSACTMVLNLPSTCATDRASFGFHKGYVWGPAGHIEDPATTEAMWAYYPTGIRRWITQHGGLTPEVKVLKGKEMRALVKAC